MVSESESIDAVAVEAAGTPVTAGTRVAAKSEAFKVVCYLNSWAWRRDGDYAFVPENVVSSTCTHLIYAYAGLDSEQLVIKMNDGWTDTQYAGKFTTIPFLIEFPCIDERLVRPMRP